MLDWQFRHWHPKQKETQGVRYELGSSGRQLEAVQGQYQGKWGKLTDDQLDVIAGKRDQLAGKIQETYGITKDEAEQQIKSFEESNKDDLPKSSS
jgi:uncharacterized protein YjbJ (UPF0337 family)